jgi:hypothetical protein
MSKRLWTISLLATVMIAAASGLGYGMPSLAGPTGIVSVPTAAVAPEGQLQVALTFQSQEMCQEMYGTGLEVDYWALNGLTGVSDEAELWGAYALADQETPTASETAHLWAIGGKYQLAREPEDEASLAVGASLEKWSDALWANASAMYGSMSDVDIVKAYIVATKDLTPMNGEAWEWGGETRMLGSVGVMYIDVDPDAGDSMSLTRPFVGLEFVGAGGTTLGMEYRWKDNDMDAKAVFSAVLCHRVSPEMELEVGTTNAGPGGLGLDDQDIFVRVGYTFPLGGEAD